MRNLERLEVIWFLGFCIRAHVVVLHSRIEIHKCALCSLSSAMLGSFVEQTFERSTVFCAVAASQWTMPWQTEKRGVYQSHSVWLAILRVSVFARHSLTFGPNQKRTHLSVSVSVSLSFYDVSSRQSTRFVSVFRHFLCHARNVSCESRSRRWLKSESIRHSGEIMTNKSRSKSRIRTLFPCNTIDSDILLRRVCVCAFFCALAT